jgi:hypothetical protein
MPIWQILAAPLFIGLILALATMDSEACQAELKRIRERFRKDPHA